MQEKEEEHVCFACLQGDDNLVHCRQRGCRKVYHPLCLNRKQDFFQKVELWSCCRHLCNNCAKNDAYYFCYTCAFSLCKGCIKDAVILCVRRNMGFCETCMQTVKLIEGNEEGNNTPQVSFDDKLSWEFNFKAYYIDLKGKLSLKANELTQAKNPAEYAAIDHHNINLIYLRRNLVKALLEDCRGDFWMSSY